MMLCILTGLESNVDGGGDFTLLVGRGEGELVELSAIQGGDVTAVLLGRAGHLLTS